MIMIDQLLSINMMMTAFVNQLLTMGLPVIDESLAELMSVMKSAPTNGLFGEMQSCTLSNKSTQLQM